MLELIYNKIRKFLRSIDMKIERAKYGYIEKLPKDIHYFEGGMYDAIYEASCKWPHNTALEYYNTQITYKELIKKINRVACALKALGVEKGDRVTICMPNTPEAVYMFYAVNEIGAVANMIHPLSSEKEIEGFLKRSNSRAMLCIDVAYPRVEAILKNTNVRHLIVVPATKSMEFIMKAVYWFTKGRKNHIKKSQNTLLWHQFIQQANRFVGNPHAHVNSDDLAVILYSGGTTGKPKGVMLSNLNFNAQALESKYYGPEILKVEHAFLTFLPNFHAFGLGICTHIPLYHGLRVVLIPQFNAKKLKTYVRRYHFNVLCGVPAVFEALTKIKFGSKELKCLKAVISGGDAMSLPQKQKINDYLAAHGCKTEVRVGYGLTEASGVVAFSPVGITDAADVIGYALPDCSFLIWDLKHEREAEPGEDGEILISGPTVMQGYLDDRSATAKAFMQIKKRRFLRTGDIGFIDRKGLLHFKARLKRIIITNGYNVYPANVEEATLRCRLVSKCAVIGVPNLQRGEIVKIFIVPKENVSTHNIKRELNHIYKQYLAKYEIPREFAFVADLPKTKLGKVDFRALEQL